MAETQKLFFARYAGCQGLGAFHASWVTMDNRGFVNPSDTDGGTPIEDIGLGMLFEEEVPLEEARTRVDTMLEDAECGFVREDYSALFA